jgi:Ca-activated chloride channel homolog
MSVAGRTGLAFALLAALAGAGQLCSQQLPAQEPPKIRVGVDRVNVGVIVTDSHGSFVEHLTRSNFHVFDDGREQVITDFVAVDEPAQVFLLIEAGPAVYLLEGGHLQAAYNLLQGLAPSDRVAVIRYSDQPQGVLELTADKQLAASALSSLHYNLGFGSLNLSTSVAQVLRWLSALQGKKTIVLLSTGVDTSPSSGAPALLTQLRAGDVRLFAVSLAAELRSSPKGKKKPAPAKPSVPDEQFAAADQLLRQFAESTGGRAYFPANAGDFRAAYAELAQLIRHEYSIAFAPPARDGQLHTLVVSIDLPSPSARSLVTYRVDHRQAYLAPPPSPN